MKRFVEIDVARGIVILLVVLGHLVAFDNFLWSWIFSFHMPFFFLVSGYCTNSKKVELSFSDYLIKCIKSILLMAITCRILYMLTGVFGNVQNMNLNQKLLKIFLEPSEWFIASLFLGRLLFWGYIKIYKIFATPKIRLLFSTFSVALLFYISTWWSESGLHHKPEYFPFPIDTSLIALAFIIIGFEARNNNISFNFQLNRVQKYLVYALILCTLVFIKNDTYVNVSDMKFGRSQLFFVLNACFWCWLICCLSFKIVNSVKSITNILKMLGKHSIIVYIGHTILFVFLNKVLNYYTGIEYVPMHNFNNYLVIIYFFITCIVFIPICFLWNYLRQRKNSVKIMRVGYIILILVFLAWGAKYNTPRNTIPFEGDGTVKKPYLINSEEEFCEFRDLVNSGISFQGQHFEQTCNLDLHMIENFDPIGIFGTDKYFYGIYNGAGYSISNLNINREDNYALFGVLGGEIHNLKIESGNISGECVGSFASHATSDGNAVIFNCYNNAAIHGNVRAGGIADNFNGSILFCINTGNIYSETSYAYGIASYSAKEVIHSYSANMKALGNDFSGIQISTMELSNKELSKKEFKTKLLIELGENCVLNSQQCIDIDYCQNRLGSQMLYLYYIWGYIVGLLTNYFIEIICILGLIILFILSKKKMRDVILIDDSKEND